MASRRDPAVAGLFYTADPAVLRADVEALLRSARAPRGRHPKVLVVPHAGYQYSGAVAAAAYCQLSSVRDRVTKVLLFGPAHRVWLDGMAVPSVDAFRSPLGDVAIDTAARDQLAHWPGVRVADDPHAQEHALEVQLPFLQVALREFHLLPFVVGKCGPDEVAAVIDRLWGGDETLIVISSDLSHFHPYAEAQRLDAATNRRILARATDLGGDEACGAAALNGLMASRRAGELDIEQVSLLNSGDTAGDRNRVVGYGAYILH